MINVVKVMLVSLITNVFLSVIKIVVGFIGSSSALIADGIHSFSDLTTDVVAMFGAKLSNKPADLKHPFGHGKLEYLTSIIIGTIILLLGVSIVRNAFSNEVSIPSLIVVIVTIITIVAKYLLSYYIIRQGKISKNSILIASGKESRADVISSIVVLIAAMLSQLSDRIAILKYADTFASIIVAFFIIKTAIVILRENVSTILGEQIFDDEYVNSIRKIVMEDENIKKIDSLVILKYGPYFEVHLEICMDPDDSLQVVHDRIEQMESKIKDYDSRLKYISTHVNPDNESHEMLH